MNDLVARPRCSFCEETATTFVNDESGPMAACGNCASAWEKDPGFRTGDTTWAARMVRFEDALRRIEALAKREDITDGGKARFMGLEARQALASRDEPKP